MSTTPITPASDSGPAAPTLVMRPVDQPPGVLGWARQAVADAAYLIVGLATGTAFFSLAVTLGSLSISLLILIIGIPVAMISSELLRWCAEVDRRRALLVDRRPIRGVYAPLEGSWVAKARTMVTDGRRWRDLGYHLIQFPVSVAGFCIAVIAWATVLALIFYPAYFWALGDNNADTWSWLGLQSDSAVAVVGSLVLGLVLLPLAYALCRGSVLVAVGLTRVLLGDDEARLRARVTHLEATRSGAVDASAAELRRIERDLHDGAQARMVAVAMDLGLAEERMADDPDGARELVAGARAEARRALSEMRELVRGIAPSVLADRGLDAALSSLIARAPVPVLLDVELDGRPPSSVETAAYFVVGEALANIAKHAHASSAEVQIRSDATQLRVRVEDDGIGGAAIAGGSGLAGLRDRVAALDGRLSVTSPEGGPTVIEAELPCGS